MEVAQVCAAWLGFQLDRSAMLHFQELWLICSRREGCGFLLSCVNMFACVHIYVHLVVQSHTPPYFLR